MVKRRSRIVPKKELPKGADDWVGQGGSDPEITFSDKDLGKTNAIMGMGDTEKVALDDIRDRAEDTRPIHSEHVLDLAESIAVLGLIEPLVLDKNNVLLAGGQRRAAIALLKDTHPAAYEEHFSDGIPVRVMDFDASKETDKALAVEIAENEKRKDYSAQEVRAIAERLKDAGFVEVKGRPKKEEKPLMPTLSAVVGKSIRTLQRYLEEPSDKKSTTHDADSEVYLKKAIANLEKWEKARGRKKREIALSKKLPEIIAEIKDGLEG